MSAGRCAGCGLVDTSCKKVKAHVLECELYLDLFHDDREKALDPETEYVRWKASNEEENAKQAGRDAWVKKLMARQDKQRGKQETRWGQPNDFLE